MGKIKTAPAGTGAAATPAPTVQAADGDAIDAKQVILSVWNQYCQTTSLRNRIIDAFAAFYLVIGIVMAVMFGYIQQFQWHTRCVGRPIISTFLVAVAMFGLTCTSFMSPMACIVVLRVEHEPVHGIMESMGQ